MQLKITFLDLYILFSYQFSKIYYKKYCARNKKPLPLFSISRYSKCYQNETNNHISGIVADCVDG